MSTPIEPDPDPPLPGFGWLKTTIRYLCRFCPWLRIPTTKTCLYISDALPVVEKGVGDWVAHHVSVIIVGTDRPDTEAHVLLLVDVYDGWDRPTGPFIRSKIVWYWLRDRELIEVAEWPVEYPRMYKVHPAKKLSAPEEVLKVVDQHMLEVSNNV